VSCETIPRGSAFQPNPLKKLSLAIPATFDGEQPADLREKLHSGRWVTILKPQWQREPPDNLQKFVIGNMNRYVPEQPFPVRSIYPLCLWPVVLLVMSHICFAG
jgi:hypothetical protein